MMLARPFRGMSAVFLRTLANTAAMIEPKAGGAAREVRGIFDQAFRVIEEIDGAPIESVSPALSIPDAHAVGVGRGDTAQIDGRSYTIRSIQPAGPGMSVLILRQ